jgi:hypothetical protein
LVVTLLRGGTPSCAARGKKRPPTAVTEVLGLLKGEFASQSSQHHRLGARHGHADLPAVGTCCRLILFTLTPAHQLPFCQPSRDFIANLTGQLFQIHQRASSRQFPLMLDRQLIDHRVHSSFQPAIHCPSLHV